MFSDCLVRATLVVIFDAEDLVFRLPSWFHRLRGRLSYHMLYKLGKLVNKGGPPLKISKT